MNPTLRNILALVGGYVLGSMINMSTLILGSKVMPLPAGLELGNMESLLANAPNFEWKHFLLPFLAHALGTLVGAFVASRFAVSHHFKLALIIGLVFMAGGVYMAKIADFPVAQEIVDISLAYIPMALLGWQLGRRTDPNRHML